MTAVRGSGGARRARRTKTWRPAQRLGLSHLPFIGGESTGSYTQRLARLNSIPYEEFWLMFGTPLRKDGEVGDPLCSDGCLNRAALERLSVMSHRPVAQLQFALPNLREHRLLDASGPPVWNWPWDAADCFLVRVCELCAQTRGTSPEAYLAADATWQVCVRHGRWLDNRREPGAAAIALTALPEVVTAHRQRLYLEQRLGVGGRALFADAYALTSCWWNIPALNPPVWQARRRALGRAGRDELRVAPLVFYPEAVCLARALAARERRRLRHTLSREEDHSWLEQVAALVEAWGMPVAEALDPVSIWRAQHPLLPRPRRAEASAVQRPARGRWRRLALAAPHTDAALQAVLGDRSCLRWQLGEMITTELAPAPGGWRLGGRV